VAGELDLPALALYVDLLRYMGEIPKALDHSWDLLERFGARSEIVPPPLVEAHATARSEKLRAALAEPREVTDIDDYYVTNVAFSATGIAIGWESRAGLPWRLFRKPHVLVFRFGDETWLQPSC
jgi:hypothetical protein